VSITSRRKANSPLSGSLTVARRRGKAALTRRVADDDVACRPAPESPFDALPHRGPGQQGGCLRRMLEIGVHDQYPGAACDSGPGHDGTGQPAAAQAGRSVQEPDRHGRRRGEGNDLVDRAVVAVVHEKDLGTERGDRGAEPVQQQRDAFLLVAGRHEDGQPGRGAVAVTPAEFPDSRRRALLGSRTGLDHVRHGVPPERVPSAQRRDGHRDRPRTRAEE
jgi:hypothetical protein